MRKEIFRLIVDGRLQFLITESLQLEYFISQSLELSVLRSLVDFLFEKGVIDLLVKDRLILLFALNE